MADESTPDAEAWGQDDWAASPRPARPAASGSRRWIGFVVAGGVGLLLLGVVFSWMRARELEVMRAEMERRMMLEEQLRMERAEGERVQATAPGRNKLPQPEPPPDQPLVLDPGEALRQIAADPEALNKLGLYQLNDLDDPDEAIKTFQEATKLDPKYQANLELARKRKVEKERRKKDPPK
ncbi:MAG: tetratricopeptide repeat protein [Gemmataceae bacterium]